jgi:signal transduction histidine kinase
MSQKRKPFSEESKEAEAKLLLSLAEQAASSIQRVRIANRMQDERTISHLGTMASILCHEAIRVMSPIRVGIAKIEREIGGSYPLASEQLRSISESLDGLDRVIEPLRQAMSGKSLSRENYPAIALLEHLKRAQRPENIELIVIQLIDDNLSIHADPTIFTAFENIYNNAVEVLCDRGGGITLSARTSEGGVLFQISDDGPGMHSMSPEEVWEFGKGTKKSPGFGLFITKYVVLQNKGRVSAENNMDRGASFFIWLPLAQQETEG